MGSLSTLLPNFVLISCVDKDLVEDFLDDDIDPQPQQNNAVEGAAQAGPADDPDERSVFVKNVDFSANEQQLTDHFKECGEIVRVTIRKNRHT